MFNCQPQGTPQHSKRAIDRADLKIVCLPIRRKTRDFLARHFVELGNGQRLVPLQVRSDMRIPSTAPPCRFPVSSIRARVALPHGFAPIDAVAPPVDFFHLIRFFCSFPLIIPFVVWHCPHAILPRDRPTIAVSISSVPTSRTSQNRSVETIWFCPIETTRNSGRLSKVRTEGDW